MALSSFYKTIPNTLLELFPAPTFLSMPAAGIDISDDSIKYIRLHSTRRNVEIDTYGKMGLPSGIVTKGQIMQEEELTRALIKLEREYHFEYAHASLPEDHAYLLELSIPKEEGLDINQVLEFRLKDNVPLSPEELIFDYLVLSPPSSSVLELSVSVYPIAVLTQYQRAFENAGITPLSFEIEGQAVARALVPPSSDETVIIVDIGNNGAGLSIVSRGILEFTSTLDSAGIRLTEAIQKELGISFEEAEALKCNNGFVKTAGNEKVFNALFEPVSSIYEEINKHFVYWQMHSREERATAGEVRRVILCGGNAPIKGLAEYLTVMLKVPVEVGNVWGNLFSLEKTIPPILWSESHQYATAIGLALRSFARERMNVLR